MIPALLALSSLAIGGYLTPEQAGFRDCMLLYEAEHRDAEDLGPWVADAGQWTFDAFLFLNFGSAPSGAAYYDGATTRDDWLAAMDRWFAPGRDVTALSEAVAGASARLGPPPAPRQVIFSLHYPSPRQHDFGDVDGDGRSEDLGNPEDRATAIAWHVDRLIERFAKARPEGLALWGFYWMNEGIGRDDEEAVRRAAEIIHARGLRFLWIPYYRAAGFDRWKELGFDAAILQPNYAFLEQHGGRIRNDRLLETASLAHGLGMGFEIESGSIVTDPRAREMLGDYLAFGSDEVAGYGCAAKAYYQGERLLRDLRDSSDGGCRAAYAELLRFLRGEPVERPGRLGGGEPALVDGRFRSAFDPDAPTAAGEPSVEIGPFPARRIEEAEVSLVRDPARRSGRAEVEVRGENGAWHPRGAREFVLDPVAANAATRVVSVPLRTDGVTGLRVRCFSEDGVPLMLDEVSAVSYASPTGAIDPARDLALGRPYTVYPPHERAYPDPGGILTDGAASERGWPERKSVGWFGTGTSVLVDLGRNVTVDSVILHCDGGGYAGVEFPGSVGVRLYGGDAEPNDSGLWSPAPVARLRGGIEDFAISWQEPTDDAVSASGALTLALPRASAARWIRVDLADRAWLMLSEIEVLSGGADAAIGRPYRYSPLPTAKDDTRYADDGLLVTDGVAPEGFEPNRVIGWSGQPAQVTLDLGAECEVAEVRAHVLGGGLYGIVAPEGLEVWVSPDGERWTEAGSARLEDPADGTAHRLTLATGPAGRARWVQLRLTPSHGWLMVGEVEVLGEETER